MHPLTWADAFVGVTMLAAYILFDLLAMRQKRRMARFAVAVFALLCAVPAGVIFVTWAMYGLH